MLVKCNTKITFIKNLYKKQVKKYIHHIKESSLEYPCERSKIHSPKRQDHFETNLKTKRKQRLKAVYLGRYIRIAQTKYLAFCPNFILESFIYLVFYIFFTKDGMSSAKYIVVFEKNICRKGVDHDCLY